MIHLLAAGAAAHYQLITAASGGPYFDTLDGAAYIEDIDRSNSANRVALCDSPYFWFRFEAPEGFNTLMVGGTVPVIERFWDTRVAVAVIGPGLGMDDIALLPSAIAEQIPDGMGAVAVPGVPDTSTCDWMEDPLSTGELFGYSPYISSYGGSDAPFAYWADWPEPRCFYHEEWGGSDMWLVQDKLVALASTGEHYLVFWAPGDQLLGAPSKTAKFGVVFGDVGQSEAFHGTPNDAGDCSLPAADFYENACRMEAEIGVSCTPFYGVPIPNLYSCVPLEEMSTQSESEGWCNTLCHNDGTCLPVADLTCPSDECAESCSYSVCGVEDDAMMRGPLGPGCPAGCTADRRRDRRLLFGSMPHDQCPAECVGDFAHDHDGHDGQDVHDGHDGHDDGHADDSGDSGCAANDYACIYGRR